jgi:hypothetical protein
MATSLDIIKSALRLIRVQDADETPSASDANSCLFALNSVLKMWAAQPCNIYQSTEISHTLTPGDGTYTVGTGLDIAYNITRIDQAFIRDGTTDLGLEIYSDSQYQDIPVKSNQGTPLAINYERGSAVRLWPVPSTTLTLRLIALVPFTELALSDTIVYPAEYQQALRYSLARDICSEYGAAWTAELEAKYQEAIGVIKAMNLSQALTPLQFNMPGQRASDLGWWVRSLQS